MMTVIIAEGRRDTELLKRALVAYSARNGLSMDTVRFSTADAGWSGVGKIARNLLRETPHRIAVIFDADTDDGDTAEERRRYMWQDLSRLAEPARVHITVVQPEFEALLFDGGVLEAQLLGGNLSGLEREFAISAPKKFLQLRAPALLRGSPPEHVGWHLLCEHPRLKPMIDFVFDPQTVHLAATGT